MPGKKSTKSAKSKKPASRKGNRKTVVLASIAADYPLSSDEVSAVKATFDLYTRSGSLEVGKIGNVLRLVGGVPSARELEQIEDNLEGKAYILFEDFLKVVQSHRARHGFMEGELREAFKIFDVDGDGEIDSAELISILTQVGDPLSQAEAEELVREADFNGDGKINYIEFVAMTVRP